MGFDCFSFVTFKKLEFCKKQQLVIVRASLNPILSAFAEMHLRLNFS